MTAKRNPSPQPTRTSIALSKQKHDAIVDALAELILACVLKGTDSPAPAGKAKRKPSGSE